MCTNFVDFYYDYIYAVVASNINLYFR